MHRIGSQMEFRELGWANLALTHMQSAGDLNEYEKSWVDFPALSRSRMEQAG